MKATDAEIKEARRAMKAAMTSVRAPLLDGAPRQMVTVEGRTVSVSANTVYGTGQVQIYDGHRTFAAYIGKSGKLGKIAVW